jgi:hypothetical protein
VTTPTAVVRGKALEFVVADSLGDDAVVNIEALGQVPADHSKAYRFEAESRTVTVSTDRLAPGVYGAWLRRATDPPHRAPLLFTVLPAPLVSPSAPGVEIVSSAGSDAERSPVSLREVSNLTVRYCRPAGTAPGNAWIGIFAADTPDDQMTRDNANVIGFWLKTPGGAAGEPCGEASAFASELAPGAEYRVLLFRDDANGVSTAVGRRASFSVNPALP